VHRGNRKTTPRVVQGRVRKKNDWKRSEDYYDAPDPRTVVIDRKRPGKGYRHVLNKSDIYRFLELLPDWRNLAVGLNAVVLAPGYPGYDGYHVPGVVHVCAWEKDLWLEAYEDYYRAHQDVFTRLGVPCEETDNGSFLCQFDEATVRDYQLLHILLHELGHHHDRMTTRTRKRTGRGEKYAEEYALQHEAAIWDRYHRAFPR
jgi:hypothetical protein